MAGFSLGSGSGGGNQQHPPQEIPPEHLFLLRNQEISSYNKSLELWQQQQQQQQQQYHQHHQEIYSSSPMGVGGPSMYMRQGGSSGGGGGGGGASGSGSGGVGSGSGGVSCQDCGNQAKKDCSHMRCRTCCKSRGFPCQTHVKSTWVPASRRRERQLQLQQHHHHHHQHQDLRSDHSKRPREILTTATATTAVAAPNLPPSTSGLEVANFPPEVSSPAVFRCVRVSAMDDGEDQYAYQTAVNIGGHVFKGILYDQGPDTQYGHGGECSSGGGNVITAGTTSTGNTNTISSTATLLDPSSLYPTPLNAFLAGTQFFPHPRS